MISSFLDYGFRHKGGVRDKVALAWQNARHNGRILQVEKEMSLHKYSVPFTGTLEVDFVDIRKVRFCSIIDLSLLVNV
jgi:hypothetical protein